jgi:uncharacterized membrane protein YdjX (TVP38/TMEM64 family)
MAHIGDETPDPPGRIWLRRLPLALLGLGLAGFLALGGGQGLSLASLARSHEQLEHLAAGHPLAAAAGFIAIYALAVAFSVPGAGLLTMTGGWLFGTWAGAGYTVIGAGAGAVAVFVAARSALGTGWRRRLQPWTARLEAGFRRDAFGWLLVLRLIPLFPFWLVNLVPAFLGVPLRTYTLATLIGIIPGTLAYAGTGSGLGLILAAGASPDPARLAAPEIWLPLTGLGLLALLPVLYRHWTDPRRPSP